MDRGYNKQEEQARGVGARWRYVRAVCSVGTSLTLQIKDAREQVALHHNIQIATDLELLKVVYSDGQSVAKGYSRYKCVCMSSCIPSPK